jgi:hypothetical protein
MPVKLVRQAKTLGKRSVVVRRLLADEVHVQARIPQPGNRFEERAEPFSVPLVGDHEYHPLMVADSQCLASFAAQRRRAQCRKRSAVETVRNYICDVRRHAIEADQVIHLARRSADDCSGTVVGEVVAFKPQQHLMPQQQSAGNGWDLDATQHDLAAVGKPRCVNAVDPVDVPRGTVGSAGKYCVCLDIVQDGRRGTTKCQRTERPRDLWHDDAFVRKAVCVECFADEAGVAPSGLKAEQLQRHALDPAAYAGSREDDGKIAAHGRIPYRHARGRAFGRVIG